MYYKYFFDNRLLSIRFVCPRRYHIFFWMSNHSMVLPCILVRLLIFLFVGLTGFDSTTFIQITILCYASPTDVYYLIR